MGMCLGVFWSLWAEPCGFLPVSFPETWDINQLKLLSILAICLEFHPDTAAGDINSFWMQGNWGRVVGRSGEDSGLWREAGLFQEWQRFRCRHRRNVRMLRRQRGRPLLHRPNNPEGTVPGARGWWNVLGCPVAETPCSQCRGFTFNPWSEN